MSKKREVRISLKPSPEDSRVEVDGCDITRYVQRVTIAQGARELPQVTLELTPIGVLVNVDGEADIHVEPEGDPE